MGHKKQQALILGQLQFLSRSYRDQFNVVAVFSIILRNLLSIYLLIMMVKQLVLNLLKVQLVRPLRETISMKTNCLNLNLLQMMSSCSKLSTYQRKSLKSFHWIFSGELGLLKWSLLDIPLTGFFSSVATYTRADGGIER